MGRIHRSISQRFFLCTVATALVGTSVNAALAENAFKTATPINEPNYATCQPLKTYASLIDGVTLAFPPWKQPQCTVWVDKTQFSILLEKKTTGREAFQELSMFMSRSTGAQVDIPRTIDVYSGPTQDSLQRVGMINIENDKYANNSSHWLSAPVPWVDRYTLLVFYSSNRFTSLEEIKLGPQGPSAPGAPSFLKVEKTSDGITTEQPLPGGTSSTPPPAPGPACVLADCITKSLADYQASLLERYEEEANSGGQAPTTFKAGWAANPFAALPVYAAQSVPVKSGSTLALSATKGNTVSALVVIDHPATAALPVAVSLSDDNNGALTAQTTLRQGLSVSNRGNLMAIDPLRKIKNALRCEVKAHCYLWVDVNTSTLAEGRHVLKPKITSSLGTVTLTLEVNVSKIAAADLVDSFYANHWGYTSDKPIFTADRKKMIASLHASGNRVYAVHPNLVPQPKWQQPWDASRETLFKAHMADIPTDSIVLLYLSWGSVGGTQRWFTADQVNTPEFAQTLNAWVDQISAMMNSYKFKAWYIYPIDELKQADFATMPAIAKLISQNKNSPKVYLTLTDSRILAPYTADQISQLSRSLALMQVNLGVVKRFPGALSGSPPFWTYLNPPSPAKAATPYDSYMYPSMEALLLGASGFGVYSLSDTGGSSAWDDFDGKQPDWAMVYESNADDNEPFVPSRRWYAYIEGIQIARILRYCNKVEDLRKIENSMDYEKLQALKTTVLSQCQPR